MTGGAKKAPGQAVNPESVRNEAYDDGVTFSATLDLLRRFCRALRDCAIGLMMPTTST
jgi:hypothetical protein